MKIQHNSTRRPQKIGLAIAALLVFLAGWLLWARHYQKWPFLPPLASDTSGNAVNYEAPTSEQTQISASTKENVAEQAKQQDSQANPRPTNEIPVFITSVQPGETVYVRAMIQEVTTGTTCKLDMSGPEGKTYSASAGTQALAGSSTCQGFNIPMSALAPGDWKITIKITDGGRSGTATTEKTL